METCKLLPICDACNAAWLIFCANQFAHSICPKIGLLNKKEIKSLHFSAITKGSGGSPELKQSVAQLFTQYTLNLWFPKRLERSAWFHSCCAFQLSCKPVMTTGMRGLSYSSTNVSYDILCTLQKNTAQQMTRMTSSAHDKVGFKQ